MNEEIVKESLVWDCIDSMLNIKGQIINLDNVDAVFIDKLGENFQVVFRFSNKLEIRHQFKDRESCEEFIDTSFSLYKLDAARRRTASLSEYSKGMLHSMVEFRRSQDAPKAV